MSYELKMVVTDSEGINIVVCREEFNDFISKDVAQRAMIGDLFIQEYIFEEGMKIAFFERVIQWEKSPSCYESRGFSGSGLYDDDDDDPPIGPPGRAE